MTMYSRVVERSRTPSPRRPVDESVLRAIHILRQSVERKDIGLTDIPEFKDLTMAIDSNYPTIHDEDIECLKCGEVFIDVTSLRKHTKEMHNGVRKGYPCPICQKSFNSTTNLQAHKGRDHSSLSDIKFCPFCNLEVLESIHTHNKNHHQYACFTCKTDFITPKERALHDGAVHNRGYICHSCWRTFQEKAHLIQHQTDSHTVYCRNCNPAKSFSSSQALDAHYHAKHAQVY